MKTAKVARIRPMSWKIYVQGKEETEYVRRALRELGLQVTAAEQESLPAEPALHSILANYPVEAPITSAELISVLQHDEHIELAFDDSTSN